MQRQSASNPLTFSLPGLDLLWRETKGSQRRAAADAAALREQETYGNPRVRLRVPGALRIDASGATPASVTFFATVTPAIPAMT
jgi:hypothetical protein